MSRARSGWSILVALALAAVLLVLALNGVDWNEAWRTIARAEPLWLVGAFACYSLSGFLRAVRWRVLLMAGGDVPLEKAFWANQAGYMGNSLLPARAGELIRSGLIARATGRSAAFALATALTERVLDAAILVALALMAFALLGDVAPTVRAAAQSTAIVVAFGTVLLLLAPRLETRIVALVRASPVMHRLAAAVATQIERFFAGTAPIRQPGRIALFGLLAALIWPLDVLAAILIGWALGIELSLPLALLLLATLGLSSAIPSTPGYVGVFQFVAVAVLTPFGHSRANAIAYILVLQAVAYAVVILWGSIGLWRLRAWSLAMGRS